MARPKDSVPVKPAQERAVRRSLTGAAWLRSRLTDVLRDLLSNPNMAIGFFILVLASLVAIFAPVIASRDPLDLDPYARLLSPSTEFYFGTDQLGRDTFSRTLHGARLSLKVGLFVAALTMSFGTVIGLVTGYYRTLDNIVMRFMDSLMAVPSFLLAIALVAILGASLANVVIALTVVETPRVVRLTRGSVLSLRERDFVQGAEAVGANAPPHPCGPHLPQRGCPIAGTGDLHLRAGDPSGGRSQLPGCRCPTLYTELGQHDGRGEDLHPSGSLVSLLPGSVPVSHCPGGQSRRRRPTRQARSKTAAHAVGGRDEAEEHGCRLVDSELMQQIVRYNGATAR